MENYHMKQLGIRKAEVYVTISFKELYDEKKNNDRDIVSIYFFAEMLLI